MLRGAFLQEAEATLRTVEDVTSLCYVLSQCETWTYFIKGLK